MPQGLRRRLYRGARATRSQETGRSGRREVHRERPCARSRRGFLAHGRHAAALSRLLARSGDRPGGRAHGAEGIRGRRADGRAAQGRESEDHGDRDSRRTRRRSALVRAGQPRALVGRVRAARREGRAAVARGPPRGRERILQRDPDRGHAAVRPGAVRPRHEALRERATDDERDLESAPGAAHVEPRPAARARAVQGHERDGSALSRYRRRARQRARDRDVPPRRRGHLHPAARRDLQGHGRQAARDSRRDPEPAERRRHRLVRRNSRASAARTRA